MVLMVLEVQAATASPEDRLRRPETDHQRIILRTDEEDQKPTIKHDYQTN
jgi:hypothetical protein